MHKRPYLTLALAGTLLAAPLAAFAQSAAAPAPNSIQPTAGAGERQHRGGAMRRALATLGLSADQTSRIKDIMKSYRQSRDTATPETRQAMRAQLEGVLTPDQRTRFAAAMRQNARAGAHGSQAPEPAPTS